MAVGSDLQFQTTVAATPPTITSYERLGSGQFRLQFAGPVGSSYTVWVSPNLGSWTPLGPTTETAPGQFEFTDADAPGHPQRFYFLSSP